LIEGFSRSEGAVHDALRGGLVNEASHEKLCGAVVMVTSDQAFMW